MKPQLATILPHDARMFAVTQFLELFIARTAVASMAPLSSQMCPLLPALVSIVLALLPTSFVIDSAFDEHRRSPVPPTVYELVPAQNAQNNITSFVKNVVTNIQSI